MDSVKIEGLEVYAGHGVYEAENKNGQLFVVDVTLYLDLRQAGETDDLTLSAHYGQVSRLINGYLREHTFQLIEAAAEHLAGEILKEFPQVNSLKLCLSKPNAPVGLPFQNVAVTIKRGWKKAYLGIGSNMGDSRALMETALVEIRKQENIRRVKPSAFIKTAPYGGVEQDDFLNGVIELETLFTPYQLLAFLQQLEKQAGRERKIHWGPRTLDLDILFYEDFVSDDPVLTVPHPDLQNRQFVLEPMLELSPYYRHPLSGKTIRDLWQELQALKGSI